MGKRKSARQTGASKTSVKPLKKAVKKKAAKKATVKKTTVKKTTVKKKAVKKAAAKATAVKKKAVKKATVAAKPTAAAGQIPVDAHCPLKPATVVADFDAMLNQTNIGANNNKFYVIQLIQSGNKHYAWTRWGRVGETGQSALLGNGSLESATANFEAKFRSKSSNKWEDRAKFVARKGKYTLIEIDRSAEANKKATAVDEKLRAIDKQAAQLQAPPLPIAKSKLHPALERFMQLIFDHKMFRGAMASFDIDVNKMPLGQLTKSQVQRGYEVLEQLEKQLEAKRRSGAKINDLSSRFYTLIPHSFGRRVPPPINTPDLVQKKFDMLNVLNDIEIALGMEKGAKAAGGKPQKQRPNPADEHYKKLHADLEWIDPSTPEHKLIETYMNATGSSHCKLKLIDGFRVDRHGEGQRFNAHRDLSERKLLWHGTNVAVVAAIMGSGLRIMPHSGGRVGKGIYLASENGKSVSYVGWSGRNGVMFLAEAALGREHTITKDDWRLKAPPKNFDCIVARGRTEPDPQHDVEWKIEGRKIIVPQGKPIQQPQFKSSHFTQSEYLVYQESQVRLRYVLHVAR